MSAFKHTPGPWHLEAVKEYLGTHDSGIESGHPEALANAHLIAAAPDLLEALRALELRMTKAARAFYEGGKASVLRDAFAGWRDEIKQARAAIAKSEGRAE